MARKFLSPIDLSKLELQNAVIQNLASAPSSPAEGQIYYDTTLHQFGVRNNSAWVYLGSGGGTVTNVSVASANGFAGTVANPTTTPAITISTSVTGLLKGNGTAISAATSGTDYAPATSGSSVLKGNGSGGFSNATLSDLSATATGDVSINSHKLTNLLDPSSAQDAATKAYVDAAAAGIDWKASVRAATTAAGTLASSFANGSVVDGVTLATGDRILIKNQATGSENGIYVVAASGAPTRATDADSNTEVTGGMAVFVEEGTTNADTGWVLTNNGAITLGTTSLSFTQFTGLGMVTAGTGLTQSGNTISLSTPVAASNGGAGTVNGILKANGSGTVSAAVSGTDYAPATSGTSILKGNGSGGTTAATGGTDYVRPFTALIGNGSSTSIAVTHSLGNQYVVAQVFDASTNAQVECDITLTSTTQTTFAFATAPATNAYRVVIVG